MIKSRIRQPPISRLPNNERIMIMGFEFRKGTVTLDLNGCKFEVDPIHCDRIRAGFVAQQTKLLDDMEQSGFSEDSVKAYLVQATETIDLMLGDGAVKRIYDTRPVDYVSICDLMAYIAQEIARFYNIRLNSYAQKQHTNRDQRRAYENNKRKS